ncbi:MAG TPA: hypothetical protein VM434_00750 [Beijerinckiaceae bacterium]|nr:hypothetical protein [Beijerinckiaceae bacterium]
MRHPHLFATRAAALAGLAAVGLVAFAPAAQAQASTCQEIAKMLEERKSLIDRLNSFAKKKVHPREVCSVFTRLKANGDGTVKWLEANQAWCQIPEAFAANLKADHEKTGEIRAQACKAAAEFAAAEKKARESQQGGGLLGGPGLTGQMRMPQGAL